MSMILIRACLWLTILVLLVASARRDLADRIIPNRLVILIAAVGLILSAVTRPDQTLLSLLLSAITFVLLGILAHYRFLGGGDAKLVAAVTLLVPPAHMVLLLVAISLAGGLLSAAYIATYWGQPAKLVVQRSGPSTARTRKLMRHRDKERPYIGARHSVPYALAVLGGVSFYLASELYKCLYATSCSL